MQRKMRLRDEGKNVESFYNILNFHNFSKLIFHGDEGNFKRRIGEEKGEEREGGDWKGWVCLQGSYSNECCSNQFGKSLGDSFNDETFQLESFSIFGLRGIIGSTFISYFSQWST